MPKAPINKTVKAHIKEFLRLRAIEKAATSERNKAQTKLKNAIKADFAAADAPQGSFYVFENMRIGYEATEGEQIAPADLLKEYEDGNITQEQFLRCIRVGFTDAKKEIGGDIVEALKQTVSGDTVDIRVGELPVEQHASDHLHIVDKPVIKRKRLGRNTSLVIKPVAVKPLRRLRIKVK